MKERMVVRKRRIYSAHHTLLRIAKDAVRGAREKRPGWKDDEFLAITMSCLAVESVCNAFGEKAIDNWCDYEKSTPTAKLRIICVTLGVNYKKNEEPWKTLKWMQVLRNEIAHPKLEVVETEDRMSRARYEHHRRLMPLSKIEKKISLGSAEKSISAVQRLIDIFGERLGEEGLDIVCDAWHSMSRPAELQP